MAAALCLTIPAENLKSDKLIKDEIIQIKREDLIEEIDFKEKGNGGLFVTFLKDFLKEHNFDKSTYLICSNCFL